MYVSQKSFILTNIRRLITQNGRRKSGFLADQADLKNSVYVAVTETWLNPEVLDSEVSHDFPGFSLFRSDRTGRQGGAVDVPDFIRG